MESGARGGNSPGSSSLLRRNLTGMLKVHNLRQLEGQDVPENTENCSSKCGKVGDKRGLERKRGTQWGQEVSASLLILCGCINTTCKVCVAVHKIRVSVSSVTDSTR